MITDEKNAGIYNCITYISIQFKNCQWKTGLTKKNKKSYLHYLRTYYSQTVHIYHNVAIQVSTHQTDAVFWHSIHSLLLTLSGKCFKFKIKEMSICRGKPQYLSKPLTHLSCLTESGEAELIWVSTSKLNQHN